MSIILRKCKGGYSLGKGKPKVNHLLFMDDLKLFGKNESEIDSLIRTVYLFSKDIRMEFGIKKCGVLVMKKGKVVSCDGILLPNGDTIKTVDEEEGYKYLGVLEVNGIMQKEMKELISKEYFRRLKKILKSKLNGTNIILAINSWAVSLVRYGAGIIEWTKEELLNMDRKTRKKLTMYGGFHPKSNVNRLYLSRNDGGRGLISIEDCVHGEMNGFAFYVKNKQEALYREIEFEGVITTDQAKAKEKWKEEIGEKHRRGWQEKPLHGQTFQKTKDSADKDYNWSWLKYAQLKKETESTIFAAYEQAIGTNAIKRNVYHEDVPKECRLCKTADETVAHIISGCPKLAQVQYKKWRHDHVAQIVHWKICKNLGIEHAERWYNHKPESVIETEHHKILWDFPIQTDHRLEHNKPDIVVVDKVERSCLVIDIACPFDTSIDQKEQEKIEKYQDLKREIKRLWNLRKVKVVPIVVGALGTVGRNLRTWIKELNIQCNVYLLQKAALLGTARILRKVLDT